MRKFKYSNVLKSPPGRVVWSVQVEAIVVSLLNQRCFEGSRFLIYVNVFGEILHLATLL